MTEPSTIQIAGFTTGRIGYGTMQLTGPNALGEPSQPEDLVRLLRTVIESGVRLIDTAGYYGPSVANRLLAKALHPYPSDLLIATKVGARRTPEGGFAADTEPAALRSAVEANLRELRLDRLDLVHVRQLPDSRIPFPDVVASVAELRDQGKVAHVGISNVTTDQLEQARAVTPIASVENQAQFHDHDPVLTRTAELGIPYLAFRPLLNGALLCSESPLLDVADRSRIAPATLALAWLLDQSPNLIAIPGTASATHLAEHLAAETLDLDPKLRTSLDALELP